MLERLAGRIWWERTVEGIRVVIPARFGGVALFFGGWLAFWIFAGMHIIPRTLDGQDQSLSALYGLVAWTVCAIFVGGWFLWCVGGRAILTLSPTVLTIQRSVFGVDLDCRTFQTRDVENLRYAPAYYDKDSFGENSYVQSKMSFKAKGWKRSFASGIGDAEARELINKMLEVCNTLRDGLPSTVGFLEKP